MKMPLSTTVASIAVIIVLVILISMLLALNIARSVPPISENDMHHKYFILDGMTCVAVGDFGISCDWDSPYYETE